MNTIFSITLTVNGSAEHVRVDRDGSCAVLHNEGSFIPANDKLSVLALRETVKYLDSYYQSSADELGTIKIFANGFFGMGCRGPMEGDRRALAEACAKIFGGSAAATFDLSEPLRSHGEGTCA